MSLVAQEIPLSNVIHTKYTQQKNQNHNFFKIYKKSSLTNPESGERQKNLLSIGNNTTSESTTIISTPSHKHYPIIQSKEQNFKKIKIDEIMINYIVKSEGGKFKARTPIWGHGYW